MKLDLYSAFSSFISTTLNFFGINSSLTKNKTVFNTAPKLSATPILVFSILIFISIFPLGSADVLYEAIIVSIILFISGLSLLTQDLTDENNKLLLPIVILALYSFLQGFITIIYPIYSPFFPVSFDPTASIWAGFKILSFALFIKLLLIFAQQNVKFLTWSLIITGNFFAVFGLLRYFFQASIYDAFAIFISPQLEVGVGFGTYFNQNHFAYLMLMILGLNLGLLWFGKLSNIIKIVLILASLSSWTALILTGSRGGILGSFVEITALFFIPLIGTFKNSGRRVEINAQSTRKFVMKRLAFLLLSFGILLAGIFFIGQDRIIERFEDIPRQIEAGTSNSETFRRTDAWQASLLMTRDFPIFGIGFGGFKTAVSKYIEISGQIVPKQAHNDYLELAASGGLVSIALTIWFLIILYQLVKKRFIESPDNFSGAARLSAVCALAGVAFHNFFDFGLQISANFLFFAGLLFIAVHKTPTTDKTVAKFLFPSSGLMLRFFLLIACSTLALFATLFGFSRYRNYQVKNDLHDFSTTEILFKIPFDSDLFETRAEIYEKTGKFELASNEIKKSIDYRPRDYELWLKLAQLEQIQNRLNEAEGAYRQSINLAPFYGKPYFFYGNFLINTGRKEIGFTELRKASLRNPRYFEQIISILWDKKDGSADELIKLLLPLDSKEKETLSNFLFNKGEYQTFTELNCDGNNNSDLNRIGLVQKLIEKNRFYFAARIYQNNCNLTDKLKTQIEDGNFEKNIIQEGTGFGWRIPDNTFDTIISYDTDQNKNQSLRFNFNGQANTSEFLSQNVVVEKSSKYRLNFSYRTKELITSNVPILQITLKKPDSATSDSIAAESTLGLKAINWVDTSVEFETDELTEAIEIKLLRKPCDDRICPIFGILWLDDFYLQKIN